MYIFSDLWSDLEHISLMFEISVGRFVNQILACQIQVFTSNLLVNWGEINGMSVRSKVPQCEIKESISQ